MSSLLSLLRVLDAAAAEDVARVDVEFAQQDLVVDGAFDDFLTLRRVGRNAVHGLGLLDGVLISEELAWGCSGISTAIGVNSLGIVLAAAGVLPVFWGAVLHNACTVAVVMNSGRLLFHDLEQRR